MKEKEKLSCNRRQFMKTATKGALASAVAVTGFPTIVTASVLGKNAPGNRLNIGAIGAGRIGSFADMPGVLYWDSINERFRNDDEANTMLSRAQRWPYQIDPMYDVKTLTE